MDAEPATAESLRTATARAGPRSGRARRAPSSAARDAGGSRDPDQCRNAFVRRALRQREHRVLAYLDVTSAVRRDRVESPGRLLARGLPEPEDGLAPGLFRHAAVAREAQQPGPDHHAVRQRRGSHELAATIGPGLRGEREQQVGRLLRRHQPEVAHPVPGGPPAPTHVGLRAGQPASLHPKRYPHRPSLAVALPFRVVSAVADDRDAARPAAAHTFPCGEAEPYRAVARAPHLLGE